jgi:hypothetical protein
VQHVEVISHLRRKLRGVHILRLRLGRVPIVPVLLIPASLIAISILKIQSGFKG